MTPHPLDVCQKLDASEPLTEDGKSMQQESDDSVRMLGWALIVMGIVAAGLFGYGFYQLIRGLWEVWTWLG